MNHFRHERGEEPFLTTLLPTTVRAVPKYKDKVSSFLAGYEALASALPRTPPVLATLDVLPALPDIKRPLRGWSHPCGSCLGDGGTRQALLSLLSLTTLS
jgi:hypothetical protein